MLQLEWTVLKVLDSFQIPSPILVPLLLPLVSNTPHMVTSTMHCRWGFVAMCLIDGIVVCAHSTLKIGCLSVHCEHVLYHTHQHTAHNTHTHTQHTHTTHTHNTHTQHTHTHTHTHTGLSATSISSLAT